MVQPRNKEMLLFDISVSIKWATKPWKWVALLHFWNTKKNNENGLSHNFWKLCKDLLTPSERGNESDKDQRTSKKIKE